MSKYNNTPIKKWHQVLPITIAKFYLLSLAVFLIFRIILFFTELKHIDLEQDSIATILQAFVMGLRFDIVICGYILFIPSFLLIILDLLKVNSPIFKRILFILVYLVFTLAFIIAAIDIPYFNQFFARFSVGAFEWMDSPKFVFQMILEEPRYVIFMIPIIVITIIYYKVLGKVFNRSRLWNKPVFLNAPIYLLILAFMFLGIRGRITKKSPIVVGTAYYCDNAFLNQLGLNPVFTLMRSYLDTKFSSNAAIELMDPDLAISQVREQLSITDSSFNSPIARRVYAQNEINAKRNVVIVIMESMSAAKMGRHGNSRNLTPFLDSLSGNSLYFENTYTAGKHTFNGVFSTLFSFPALYRQHPMKHMHKYNGIADALAKHKYETAYFTTHDAQFDNAEGFLINNSFRHITGQKDYPSSEIKTTLGVSDDYMFRYAIPKLNDLYKEGPFLSVFMTASDHPPFYIPPYFEPTASNEKDRIVQYADWSLRKLFNLAKQQDWYENTLFVFVADHGVPLRASYDIVLDYHHSPLLFYAPGLTDSAETRSQMSSQLDVFPTIMGLLNLPYLHNNLGIDLMKNERPYVLINDDDKVGIMDEEFLLIMKDETLSKLYKYKSRDREDHSSLYPEKVKEMEQYAKSQMQTYQALLNRSLTYEKE
ncbi:MAG: sulfatase-like hydrolase/transferase [Bacteroidia bacterium]